MPDLKKEITEDTENWTKTEDFQKWKALVHQFHKKGIEEEIIGRKLEDQICSGLKKYFEAEKLNGN